MDANGKRVYKDANGNIKKAPNGFYHQADGSIWIDLNAGNRGQGTMLYTVAHELTHFIKQWSPTKFKALADFLVEQYGKEGVSVHELVLAQQEKAKKNGREISYDVAFEEMVADSMETMLTDGKVIRELAKKDKGLFNKIKSWIDNLLRKLSKEYKNYSPESKEGQLLLEMTETFKEAQKLFADSLTDASDNYQANKGQKNTTSEGDVKLSDKNYDYWLDKIENISDEDALKTRSEITYLSVADSTPNILQKYGALNLPLVIRFDAMYLAQRGSGAFEGHYHHLGKNIMGNLIDYVSNPDAILKTITKNKKGEDVTKLIALVSIPIKSGEALASIEINTVKDIGEGDELYNLIVTFFDYKENYLRNLFVKYDAQIKYKKETLSKDNPKLHKWFGTIQESVPIDSIPQTSKKSQEKLSDRDYSYETLTNKPDMQITVLNDNPLSNRAEIVKEGKKNVAHNGKQHNDGSVSVYVNDIDSDIIVTTESLRHGLDRRTFVIAPVVEKVGVILKNSIRINELLPREENTKRTQVLIGTAKDKNNNPYIVTFVVNTKNEVVEMDVLYSVNVKKESAVLNAPRLMGNPNVFTDSTISISNLLKYVNKYFPDILPSDVLKYFGYSERPKGKLGESALFSERDTDSVSTRSLLANALEGAAQNDIEKNKLAQYKEKIALIEAEQNKLHELREKLFTKGIKSNERREIQEEATRTANRITTYDRQLFNLESTTALKNVLTREKELARKRQKQKDAENLKAYKEQRDS